MIDVRPTVLPGCFEIRPTVHRDGRGVLAKPFRATTFEMTGLATNWRELFYSVSDRGVIRGLHFQLPPSDQTKMVTCVSGEVFDVVLDLRVGSPTFGRFETFFLSGHEMATVLVPNGAAHGFAALTDTAVVSYAVTTEHDSARDAGIRWDSVPGLRWPIDVPTLSERDATLPTFGEFVSPFSFEAFVA